MFPVLELGKRGITVMPLPLPFSSPINRKGCGSDMGPTWSEEKPQQPNVFLTRALVAAIPFPRHPR